MGQTLTGPLLAAAKTEFEIIRDRFRSRLSSGQLDGYHFDHGACIAGHRVDFRCEAAGLLIDIHPSEGAEPSLLDEARICELEAAGYLVLHLWEQDLRRGLDPALDFVRQALAWREPVDTVALPSSRSGGA